VLYPGDEVTATATYELTQADLDRGEVSNHAVVSGKTPDDELIDTEDDVDSPIPGLSLVKSADVSAWHDPVRVGDVITYTLVAENTGKVTLSDVVITDSLVGLSGLVYGEWPGVSGVLEPGESITATATYPLTQANLDAGHVANVAVAKGQTPDDDDATSTDETDTEVHGGGLDLVKTADVSKVQSPAMVGDVITYTLEATNNGSVTLTDVVLSDPLLEGSTWTYEWPGDAAGELSPGQSVTAEADYVLTQTDLDVGRVVNNALASGNTPDGDEVKDTDQIINALTAIASVDLVKTADDSAVHTPSEVGDLVTFSFVVTNTGTVTLNSVGIADELPGLSDVVYHWPSSPDVGHVLAPGQVMTATATYHLTQEDLAAGHVANYALASGRPVSRLVEPDPNDPGTDPNDPGSGSSSPGTGSSSPGTDPNTPRLDLPEEVTDDDETNTLLGPAPKPLPYTGATTSQSLIMNGLGALGLGLLVFGCGLVLRSRREDFA
jgi:uncharacterized repeat protein (TIGR01451 family)